MGRPVVHFEVMGRDGPALREFYSTLFDWEIDADNPIRYGTVRREDNLTDDGVGIGGGIGQASEDHPGHVTFYVAVPDVGQALEHAERLGGRRVMGPESPMPGVELGMFLDPEDHLVGLVRDTT